MLLFTTMPYESFERKFGVEMLANQLAAIFIFTLYIVFLADIKTIKQTNSSKSAT